MHDLPYLILKNNATRHYHDYYYLHFVDKNIKI